MRRRDILAIVGEALVAWPLAAQAQPARLPVIGYLSGQSAFGPGFRAALAKADIIEGRDVAVEYRYAEGDYRRLPALASELVRLRVDVIYASPSAAALAAKAATSTIPIVFLVGPDPVSLGLVESLSHPGGNLTGFTLYTIGLIPKLIETMSEALPQYVPISLFYNSTNPIEPAATGDAVARARTLGRTVTIVGVASGAEIDAAMEQLAARRPVGIIVGSDPLFEVEQRRVIALAARYAVPTLYAYPASAENGGLMAYGVDDYAIADTAIGYVAKILRGARPADLPVQQPTVFQLVVNLKTAKTLGLTLPEALLVRADKVIE